MISTSSEDDSFTNFVIVLSSIVVNSLSPPPETIFKRISSHKNKSFSQDTHEQKLAIPAYKRKNINLDNESSENDQSKTLDFTEED